MYTATTAIKIFCLPVREALYPRNAGAWPGEYLPFPAPDCHGHNRKKNMQDALEEVLVRGLTRREACERHGVSQSHFSVKYRRLQMVNQTVVRMYPYIVSDIRMTE